MSKNGLLGRVCAGFLCHQFSKFCFNLTCVLLGTLEVLSCGWVLGALRLFPGGGQVGQVLISCFCGPSSRGACTAQTSINQNLTHPFFLR